MSRGLLYIVVMKYYPLTLDHVNRTTIKGICSQYNAIIKNPRKDGGGDVPGYEGKYMVWTPTDATVSNNSWENKKSGDNTWIVERNKYAEANQAHVDSAQAEAKRLRITFWRNRLGYPYEFIGVFQIDQTLTQLAGVRIYRKISDTLPRLEIK